MDNYPIERFPGVWRYVHEIIQSGDLTICDVAYDEVADRSPECHNWLRTEDIERFEVDQATIHVSLDLKSKLGIVDDNYHPKGVGENDLLIIASAKVNQRRLVTNEARQDTNLPSNPARYKIPAVCGLAGIDVPTLNFLDLLQESDQPF